MLSYYCKDFSGLTEMFIKGVIPRKKLNWKCCMILTVSAHLHRMAHSSGKRYADKMRKTVLKLQFTKLPSTSCGATMAPKGPSTSCVTSPCPISQHNDFASKHSSTLSCEIRQYSCQNTDVLKGPTINSMCGV